MSRWECYHGCPTCNPVPRPETVKARLASAEFALRQARAELLSGAPAVRAILAVQNHFAKFGEEP